MRLLRDRLRLPQRSDGAVAIEFALMAPLVLLLVWAVVQFGFVLNAWQGVHAAAREGARVGSLSNSTDADVLAAANGALDGVSVQNVSVAPGSCAASGQTRTVTVSGTVPIVAIPWMDTPPEVTVTGEGQFRCE